MKQEPILRIENLSVSLGPQKENKFPIDNVSFSLFKGKCFALVGESGCGKSMTALAIMRLLPMMARVYQSSHIYLNNEDLLQMSEAQMQSIRGQEIGIVFQDPMASLNPVQTIGQQIIESLKRRYPYKARFSKMLALLSQVQLPEPKTLCHQYPHQLSGGMKQRVVIAMALAQSPKILIADEPTTALDVTIQAQILRLLKELIQRHDMALLLITHDLGVVAQMADEVGVMYAGHLIEHAQRDIFFTQPEHPYSQQLFEALPEKSPRGTPLNVIPGKVPSLGETFRLCRFLKRCTYRQALCDTERPPFKRGPYGQARCHFAFAHPNRVQIKMLKNPASQSKQAINAPIFECAHLNVQFPISKRVFGRPQKWLKAVDDVCLQLYPGRTLALVGESGSGKSTVGKAILKLLPNIQGRLRYQGRFLDTLSSAAMKPLRQDLQLIFQDPFSSMDPRMQVIDILSEGIMAQKRITQENELIPRIDNLLEQVGLQSEMKYRFAHEFSGGQRQRIAIARALGVEPKLIVCDEPTSALDVSVQAQILNVLFELQRRYTITYLFITHDMGVVRHFSDEVAVMYLGQIVETGSTLQVLEQPLHPYTQLLIQAVPSVDQCSKPLETRLVDQTPVQANCEAQGCQFSTRCPFVMPKCRVLSPQLSNVKGENRSVRCFLYEVDEEEDKECLNAPTCR